MAEEARMAEVDPGEKRRNTARVFGEEAVAYLDSVPTMPSLEIVKLATSNNVYRHLREAAQEELEARAAILDEIIAERRQAQ